MAEDVSKERPLVLFETEGSYPFSGGGVSTWSHILCHELQDHVDFILYALTGNTLAEYRYQLSPNIKDIVHVPLWGSSEPFEYYDRDRKMSRVLEQRMATTPHLVDELFVPLFRDFVNILVKPYEQPAAHIGEVLYGLWKYYQHYDYKRTLQHSRLWSIFKDEVDREYDYGQKDSVPGSLPNAFDVTFGMRWLYHFLMPLAVPVPEDITVSHATIAGFPSIASIAARYEYGVPSMVTDHGVFIRERLINVSNTDFPYYSKRLLLNMATMITRAIYSHSDRICPVAVANKTWEMRYDAPEERITPIPNGVDTTRFAPTPKPQHTADRPTVVAVAHVFPLKDIETMIRACEVAKKEIPDVRFIVYGSLDIDEAYVARCRQLVSELQLEENFEFGGFHSNPAMIFNEGDISILSSISEGFPYTIIESMSCARPVVATDVGGNREILEDCGILSKARDHEALGKGVIKFLQDEKFRVDMGRKSREKVLLKYTQQKSVDAYKDFYYELSSRPIQPLKHQVQTESVKHLIEWVDEFRFA